MPTVPTSSAPVATNQTSFSTRSRSTISVTRRRMREASLAAKSSSSMGSSPAQPPFQPKPSSSSSSSVVLKLSHEPISLPTLRASNSSSTPSQPFTSAFSSFFLRPSFSPPRIPRLGGFSGVGSIVRGGSPTPRDPVAPMPEAASSAQSASRLCVRSGAVGRAGSASRIAENSIVSNSGSRAWPRCGCGDGCPSGSAHAKSSGSAVDVSRPPAGV